MTTPNLDAFLSAAEERNHPVAIEKLITIIRKLKEANVFYATGDYSTCEAIGQYHSPMDEDGGKRARQAAADIEKMLGGEK